MNLDARSVRIFRALAITVLVIVTMWVAAELLKPIALAILFAFILNPVVQWLDRRGLPRIASIGVTLTLVLTLLGLGGYLMTQQFLGLAEELPRYESNIISKVSMLQPDPESPIQKAAEVVEHVDETLSNEELAEVPTRVRVVQSSGLVQRAETMLDPFQELAAWTGAVLLLLVFLLLYREDLGDRIVQLAGHGQISLTTKTLGMIASRLSRYLAAFSLFNAGFGAVIGLMLYLFGLPYALLWGMLAAILRFIPYLGPALAFALPVTFAFAHDPGWVRPVLIIAAYGLAELVANSVEPIVYGRTIGVASLGLLLSAMFWAWLWGGLGLLLATPLTVCLAVIGKHVQGLAFLDTLLGEHVRIEPDLRFYQKLQNRDQDGAVAVLEEAMRAKPIENVFDEIVVPALSRTGQDQARGALALNDVVFHWRVVQEWLDDLEEQSELMASPAPNGDGATGDVEDVFEVVGIATEGVAEVLILRMVRLTLRKTPGIRLWIVETIGAPLVVSEQVAELEPDAILLSHLPPMRLTHASYLFKRLQATRPDTPMIMGYWDHAAALSEIQDRLQSIAIYRVALTVASVDEMIESLQGPDTEARPRVRGVHATSGMKPAELDAMS